jgi:hypothetical protein
MYLNIIISINNLNIMVTLCVYFEYIKIIFKIFIKYCAHITSLSKYIIILFKIITNDIYYLYYIILYIFINYR